MRVALLFLIFCAGLGANSLCAQALRAGAARIDITPEKPVQMFGYASRTNLSTGVHDPISARALAMEAGGKRLMLMSVEICGFYNNTADPFRQAILKETGLDPSELFMAAIHTHSAPTPGFDASKLPANNLEYTPWLQDKLVTVARLALQRLAPVELGVGVGSSPIGANRREPVRDENGNVKIVLGRNPALLTDREVQVLKLARPDSGKLVCAFFAYATHSTSLGAKNFLISGDIHGLTAQFVEKILGDGVVAPPFAGASGNIDPWYRVLPEFKTTNGWIPEPILLSTLLGEEVVTVLSGIKKSQTNNPIRTAIKTIELPGKTRGQLVATNTDPAAALAVTVASVGEIAFVGLGGEVFTEIGQSIKKASPFTTTIVMTHCNGAAGYLPTTESYLQGGYEVQSSPFAPGADEKVVQEVKRLLAQLR